MKGSVACSLENGRLFASYQSGAIAAVLDSQGVGTVTSPAGKSLLQLGFNNASVYDNNGSYI